MMLKDVRILLKKKKTAQQLPLVDDRRKMEKTDIVEHLWKAIGKQVRSSKMTGLTEEQIGNIRDLDFDKKKALWKKIKKEKREVFESWKVFVEAKNPGTKIDVSGEGRTKGYRVTKIKLDGKKIDETVVACLVAYVKFARLNYYSRLVIPGYRIKGDRVRAIIKIIDEARRHESAKQAK